MLGSKPVANITQQNPSSSEAFAANFGSVAECTFTVSDFRVHNLQYASDISCFFFLLGVTLGARS